jgi:hypothetical protein
MVAESAYLFRHVSPPVCLSAYISVAPTGPISVKFYIGDFYENLLRKSKFGQNRAKISGNLYGDSKYVLLLLATEFRHKSIAMQPSVFLYFL